MPKLRDLHLDPYSLALARKILAAFPQWESFVGRAEREEDRLRVYVLQIEVPSANPVVLQPLTISVELDRTVLFRWYPVSKGRVWTEDWVGHSFDTAAARWREDPSGFDRIVAWLRDFVSEARVAASWYEDGTLSASGAPLLSELAERNRGHRGNLLVRSWRGTHDVDRRPGRPLPSVIVLGDPESKIARFVAESLSGEVDGRGTDSTERLYALMCELGTDRVILIEPDWDMALRPHPYAVGVSGQGTTVVRAEDQSRPSLFVVRAIGANWTGPWEDASFEVRDPYKDGDLLRRHVLAWLREP